MDDQKVLIGVAVLFVVTCVALGTGMYYAGYYADRPSDTSTVQVDIAQDLMKEISADKISEYLKHLSSVPHLAGTDQDFEQAEWLRQNFEDFGLDQAIVVPYQVLLSYPNMTQPNKVYLMDGMVANFTTSGRQDPLYTEEERSPLVAPNFNAYSGTGTKESAGLVYAYYGLASDYDYLESLGINVSGQIVLARYGEAFRGNIVELAQRKGAVGVLLYSDPQDFAQQGRNQKYPDSWWMPGMAVQSGTVYLDNGDPLTPFYPAIESAYRVDKDNCPVAYCPQLPEILVQPIGYDEAEVLLNAMEGVPARNDWKGDLDAPYNLGPGLKNNFTIKMEVYTSNKMVTTYNTIGIIRGEVEPDRYVLVGNHRDAWILGALDPSSGTAAMLEMARAFSKMRQDHGWKPRRSIVFCSWGAEEYGLIGSYEWVEQYAKVLSERAVAYINVDIAVEGNYSLRSNGAPLMHQVVMESAKRVPNPDPAQVALGRTSIFDTWLATYPDSIHREFPRLRALGSGSDYTAFMHVVGVPSLDLRYTYEENIGSYPLYHTLYETHHLLANIMDQNFHFHRAITQLWSEVSRTLMESIILPMDIRWYADYLQNAFVDIRTRYGAQLAANGATLDHFQAAVTKFDNDTLSYAEKLKDVDTQNVLAVRRINDQLMQLERHFVDPQGLPNRAYFNHIVFAPSSSDNYASSSFSGLTDLLESVGNRTESQSPLEWAQIKQHLAVIAFRIQSAGSSLHTYSIV